MDSVVVVTKVAFYKYWIKLVNAGFTHQKAYDAAEVEHERITGHRHYTDFRTFDRWYWRYKANTKNKLSTLG